MTRPGFRKGRSGGGRQSPVDNDGLLSSSLFSQAQILHLMKNEFARARRHGIPMGIVLLQVDRIAQLADLHGSNLRHSVKHAVALLVREKTRGSDMLGTTNDDRYLLVMPHTDLDQARMVADRLHEAFLEVEVTVDGSPLSLTASRMYYPLAISSGPAAYSASMATLEGAIVLNQQRPTVVSIPVQ